MKGRPKPLHGAKKYSLLPLPCSVKDCDAEFFACYASGKRFCEDHMPYYASKAMCKNGKLSNAEAEILSLLGL